jgi:hypothetical protein
VPAALMVKVLGPHPVEGQQSETMVKFFLPPTTPLSTSAPRCLSVSRLSPIRVRLFLFMFLILPEADLAPCQLPAATVVPDRTPAIAAISTQLHPALVHRRYTGGTRHALLATDRRPTSATPPAAISAQRLAARRSRPSSVKSACIDGQRRAANTRIHRSPGWHSLARVTPRRSVARQRRRPGARAARRGRQQPRPARPGAAASAPADLGDQLGPELVAGERHARRTFISIARADGAVADTLHFATHGPDGDIMDDYTTMPWPALCAEVAKVRISLREGKLLEMPMLLAADGTSGLAAPLAAVLEPSVIASQSWRSGRDLNPKSASRDHQPSCASAVTTQACAASVSRFVPADPACFHLAWQRRGSRSRCVCGPGSA